MAGLVPAIIHPLPIAWAPADNPPMGAAFVYIMTNRANGILYSGVTNNMPPRAWEHREALIEGFTKRYGPKRLVYVEPHADIQAAIQRERNMKHWPKAWKVRLILDTNPDGADLYDQLL